MFSGFSLRADLWWWWWGGGGANFRPRFSCNTWWACSSKLCSWTGSNCINTDQCSCLPFLCSLFVLPLFCLSREKNNSKNNSSHSHTSAENNAHSIAQFQYFLLILLVTLSDIRKCFDRVECSVLQTELLNPWCAVIGSAPRRVPQSAPRTSSLKSPMDLAVGWARPTPSTQRPTLHPHNSSNSKSPMITSW